jgi:hypothetical protein
MDVRKVDWSAVLMVDLTVYHLVERMDETLVASLVDLKGS